MQRPDTPPSRPPSPMSEPVLGCMQEVPKDIPVGCELEEVGLKLVEEEPVVLRKCWGAMDAKNPPQIRSGPPTRIVVVDTGTTQCKTLEQCSLVLRDHQEAMIYENGEDDLPYNFLVGGDGRVYEGRGWMAKLPIPEVYPDEYEDDTSFIIALIGDFSPASELCPPEKMVKARREFVLLGKDIGLFDKKIEVWTQLQWKI